MQASFIPGKDPSEGGPEKERERERGLAGTVLSSAGVHLPPF